MLVKHHSLTTSDQIEAHLSQLMPYLMLVNSLTTPSKYNYFLTNFLIIINFSMTMSKIHVLKFIIKKTLKSL